MVLIPISPCCLKGGVLTGETRGRMEPKTVDRKISRYHTFPVGGEGAVRDKQKAVVLFTDPGGLGTPNPKIIADALAEALKLNVYVPEYFPKTLPHELIDGVAPIYPDEYANRSWLYTIWLWITTLWKIRNYLPMMLSPNTQIPLAQAALNDLKAEGYTSLGAIGYCRGAAIILHLMSIAQTNRTNSDSNSSSEQIQDGSSILDIGVLCHPSPERKTYGNITKPTSWQLPDHDPFMTFKEIAYLRPILEKKQEEEGIDFEVVVHKDTVHGFASRPTLDHEPTKEAFENANQNAVNFFNKHFFGKE
ncbi:uncharacterized protein I303_108595 [Kwoniella dejecticola CBS 10117]|uniref:Dienelactone hydrolase domain-containing protein n=1 Tax=Kwoniella dejecticola CBS 10117 TaxID=1296121 RepID=A0A1A5ZWY4_9TREE|nr:uncharacterized protein I303_07080 [Kwoniella dejecticola CBS 10117]OBR82321.1 hypothetical protein I303_07080 [Kwoniella dejecticola CBS 10117]